MTLDVVGAAVTFLIDPGATYSALLWSHSLSQSPPNGGMDNPPMAISLPSYLVPWKVLCSPTPS